MDNECERRGRRGTLVTFFFNCCVWMTLSGEQLFQNAYRVTGFYRIVNAFLGNTHAPFAKSLQYIRLRNALQALKLQIANNWQLFDFEYDIDATARAFFSQNPRSRLIKKPES